MRRFPIAGLLPVATLLFVLMSVSAGAADWKGTETTVDGQLHVNNPADAIDPAMEIELEEVFRLGGWDGGDDEFFGVIVDIEEDAEGNLYVLDAQLNEIKIYGPDGEYLNSIGREGEGPGEFRNAGGLFWLPDGRLGVVQAFPGRLITLHTDGTPGDDFTLDDVEGGGFRMIRGVERAGDNVVVIYGLNNMNQETMKFTQTNYLMLVDPDGHELKEMHSHESHIDFASPKITEIEFDNFMNRWTTGADGRVYAVPVLSEYAIKVWGPDGNLDRIIEREYGEHERNAEEKAELEEKNRKLQAQLDEQKKDQDERDRVAKEEQDARDEEQRLKDAARQKELDEQQAEIDRQNKEREDAEQAEQEARDKEEAERHAQELRDMQAPDVDKLTKYADAIDHLIGLKPVMGSNNGNVVLLDTVSRLTQTHKFLTDNIEEMK